MDLKKKYIKKNFYSIFKTKNRLTFIMVIIGIVMLFTIPGCNTMEPEELIIMTKDDIKIDPDTRKDFGDYKYDLLELGNEHIRMSLGKNAGGAICHISLNNEEKKNMINNYDLGRLLQVSVFGYKDGSTWLGNDWVWNPIQAGDWLNQNSNLAEIILYPNGTSTYVKTNPLVHWATGESIPSVNLEQWTEIVHDNKNLVDDIIHIHYKITYSGSTYHPARHQEMPAFYTTYDNRLITFFNGEKNQLESIIPKGKNEYRFNLPEHWVAYTNPDTGTGIGVYSPETTAITFFLTDGPEVPHGRGCAYVSPIRTIAIEPGTIIEFDSFIKLGTVKEIRDTFRRIEIYGFKSR